MKYAFWTIFDRSRRWLPWVVGIAAGSLLAFWLWISLVQPHVSDWLAKEPEVVIDTTTVQINELVNETSPYLKRHANDLIDWRPWNDETFKLAAEQDKPLFVMVGYSSCYVCRVMASESFDDVQIATVLNSHFIPVMVDREERPDLDERLMLATQLIRQKSGWPNMVWLTPAREPWMASSYLKRDDLLKTLNDLAEIWKKQRDRAVTQAADVSTLMDKVLTIAAADQSAVLDREVINTAVDKLNARFDPLRGGFRGSPKFPPHGALAVLMHHYKTTGKNVYENPIKVTLDGMWLGGLHDHIGGGFHRYAADAQWRLPRYEKLLSDNALHLRSYAQAYAAFRTPHYRDAVTEIYDWTMRDMTSPDGAFYTAVDSGELGERGNWYLWGVDEINKTLGVEDAKVFQRVYNIDPMGNLPGAKSQAPVGLNNPYLSQPVRKTAEARDRDPELFAAEVADMRQRLREARDAADQPAVDQKILADANGLMIGSLAYAGMAMNRPNYVDVAARAAEFVTSNMIKNHVLYHSYSEGEASQPAFLRDYAALTDGLLTLYEATNDPRWLAQARLLADQMITQFADEANGGFYFTDGSDDDWPQRSKGLALLDNSPDSNGLAAIALMRLGTVSGVSSYTDQADRTILSLLHYHTSKHVTNGEHLLLAAAMRLEGFGSSELVDAPSQARIARAKKIASLRPNEIADKSRRLPPLAIDVYASQLSVKPGQTTQLAIAIRCTRDWFMLAEQQEGNIEAPPAIAINSSSNLKIGQVQTPPMLNASGPEMTRPANAFLTPAWFVVPVTIPADTADGPISLSIEARAVMFDSKTPMSRHAISVYVPITIDADAPATADRHADVFETLLSSSEEDAASQK